LGHFQRHAETLAKQREHFRAVALEDGGGGRGHYFK